VARLSGFIAVFVLALVIVPPILDAGKGMLTPTEGCKVTSVVDGDTLKIFCRNWQTYRARVLAYDTPELFSPNCVSELILAARAKWYLRLRLWGARSIVVRQEAKDRYGRRLIVLLIDGQGVARDMVEAGLARWYDGGLRASWCDPVKVERDV
jgi:endonuclease YncB( thermonuclease family)